MARTEELTIDLASLTEGERAIVRDAAALAGLNPSECDLADPPVPVLAGLIFVVMRRTEPRITQARCVRLAQAQWEARDGG